VYAKYHAEPEILFDVPPECFVPRPEVYSSVVKLDIHPYSLLVPEEEAVFFSVVKAAFGQRRKTLVNALFAVFGNTMRKEDIEGIVRSCGFDPRIRGETLGIEEFVRLSALFYRKK
jgi:16S rRNA (adenine1518-N6/adenine1519-N6)-dimethyltransferase